MKDQLQIIREFVESVHEGEWAPYVSRKATLAAITQLEAMVGEQEPVAWIDGGDLELMRKQGRGCIAWGQEQNNAKTPLYAAPVAQQYEAGDMASAAAQGFRDGVASVTQQEPVAWVECDGELVWNNREAAIGRNLYTAAPPAQQRKTVTNDEQASAYMDARLWEFIDMAGMWPRAKPDPRIWAHVMVYAPVAQQHVPEADCGDITPAELAKRIERGEKWEVAQQPQAEAVPQWTSCRCFDEVSKRLCADKNRCSQVVAASAATQQAKPNSITFYESPTVEVLRIGPAGRLFWRGREIETDAEVREAMLDVRAMLSRAIAAPQQAEPTCNPHPKAPHGFNRNASHNAGRYVCECEGWDAWDAGYSAGWQAGFDADAAPQQAEAVPNTLQKAEARLLNLIGEYWALAYAEGEEGRNHDTEDGAAQRTHAAIAKAVNDLIAAASSAPQQAKAVPMTDGQTRYMAHEAGWNDIDPEIHAFIDGIRAAERHHGIVGKEGA